MKDKELKLEDVEAPHTLGGAHAQMKPKNCDFVKVKSLKHPS
jgi:hypothetical protein